MTDKLKGAFHGCPHHGDDYEACIQHSGTAPCGVLEERDALRQKLLTGRDMYEALVERCQDAEIQTSQVGMRLRQYQEERDALAAHVERIKAALDPKILDWIDCGMATNNRHKEEWARDLRNELHQAIEEAPTTSLAHLIADKQAEALEEAADCAVPAMHKMSHWLRARSGETRLQAEEVAK